MAYDQGYYQPSQRPYNGRAAQPSGPTQSYSQPPPQQYDQYPQEYPPDGHVYDDYNNGAYDYNDGYGQEYERGYHDVNGGGRGNGYPPTNQSYPPRQEHYGNGRSGAPRGGAPRGPPMQRGPPPDGGRGRYDGGQDRDYPTGGPAGRGGRPIPLERSAQSDPGFKTKPRKPLKTPPRSPDQPTWDNPFPTFPGAKKKTSVSEEQKLVEQMAKVDVKSSPQNRPRTNGSKSSQDRYPNGQRGAPTDDHGRPMDNPRNVPGSSDYGRPSGEGQRRGPPPDAYGRPSAENQGNMPPRGYPLQGPPQPRPQDSQRGPPERAYGQSWDNGYVEPGYNDRKSYEPVPNPQMREGFTPPGRSMTVPMEKPMPMGRQAPSAPYNGPVGRGGPQRPSTATGSRPPPQKGYQNHHHQQDPYSVDRGQPPRQPYSGHQPGESIDAVFDSYFDEAPTSSASNNARPLSAGSEMPNFEALAAKPVPYRRGNSIDEHIRPEIPPQSSYSQELKPVKSQPDFRGQAQPQAAVFEMAAAPPLPNAMPPQGYDDDYGQEPSQQGYGQYRGAPPQNNYQAPPRSASAAPRTAPGYGGGLPNGPRPGLAGLPKGPSPQGPIRANTMPRPPPSGPDSLPSHPPPVRAGLIPNSVANLASNKPPPVRNYNNNTQPVLQQPNSGQPPTQQAAVPQAGPAPAPQVTTAELERLRNSTKMNPNDQATHLLLAQKLVEASKVLVENIPDQRARNKTRERYVMDAHKLLKKLVQGQNVDAMFFLADCHGNGELGLENDPKEAFTLYQSAAKAGHAAAAYRTAVCCELGNDQGGGTRKDPLKAIQWYKRAATLGDTPAMYKMGMILLKGLLGQPKNPREAVGWLKRAAERADAENPHALHELGLLFEQPQSADTSILRDEAYSFQLFQEAADLGYKFSQFRLGCAYEYGLFNCPIDPRQSIMWYSKAADQEEHQSELALSGWYLTGSEGVLQQSDSQAYLWARKAAIAELSKAEYAMGYFTEVGIGTLANLEDAKRWYWRAAAQNFPKARERLEDLKRGGAKGALRPRERISRSKVGKQNEGECSVM